MTSDDAFHACMLLLGGLIIGGAILGGILQQRADNPDPCRPALLARPNGATSVVCPDARQRIRMVDGEIACACEEATP